MKINDKLNIAKVGMLFKNISCARSICFSWVEISWKHADFL